MKSIISALALILICTSVMAASQKTAVTVRPQCTVSGANCTVGDIALVQCQDQSAAQRVRSTVVCSSPLPGKSRNLPREQVLTALRRAGLADKTYDLLCPPQVSLTRGQSTVTGQMIFDAAKAFLETGITWPGTTVVEAYKLPADQVVPLGQMELRARDGARAGHKGQNSVPIEIVIDGKMYRLVQATALVKVVAPVLIATKPIARSEAISAANTALEERDITRLASDALTELPASDVTASAPIAQGAIIRGQCISAPPAVKACDAVMVVVESQGVRLADTGTAVQDGRTGDRIKVRMAGDAREIRGIVAEPGVVKISMGGRTN
jgi:flagellar basal body P-ring formation protein FlgA